jgi:peptidylprolyl isomerase
MTMSNDTVKDRSGSGREAARNPAGGGMPSKSERRALGKAAARKRAIARRRRELRNRVIQIAAPFVAVGLIIGAIFLFGRGGANNTAAPSNTASAVPSSTAAPWTLPAGMDPQLATKPTVTAGQGTLSALKVTTLITGTGAAVQTGDVVEANYVGVSYATGQQFDSTWTDDTTTHPFQFPVGVGQVIQGWDQGLVGVTVGSRVQLDIPQSLAYPSGNGPSGDLRFVVDVVSIASSTASATPSLVAS